MANRNTASRRLIGRFVCEAGLATGFNPACKGRETPKQAWLNLHVWPSRLQSISESFKPNRRVPMPICHPYSPPHISFQSCSYTKTPAEFMLPSLHL
ncbi:hypothetical protein PRIPAC_83829 [Pristionchus pacificus]|uniref:Uncharacterized protein n=1 Tax=Pristionchus pacificus TaxID=54126 RepID=A0A2A6BLT7_PRIPA|nr:hypothetical protein PRIPAC_83829 [Pristionchus pacificus]|eukprot:PDM66884.1 hypothetical protein PRIPAC_48301 [Pristionchus pacificus]